MFGWTSKLKMRMLCLEARQTNLEGESRTGRKAQEVLVHEVAGLQGQIWALQKRLDRVTSTLSRAEAPKRSSTEEQWDSRDLGCSEEHIEVASVDEEAVDRAVRHSWVPTARDWGFSSEATKDQERPFLQTAQCKCRERSNMRDLRVDRGSRLNNKSESTFRGKGRG